MLATIIGIMTIVFGGATRVSAHATLNDSSPRADAVLAQSPTEIVLLFSEDVDPTSTPLRLLDVTGREIPLGSVHQTRGKNTFDAAINTRLATGSYVVAYSAVSADSHAVNGAFGFSVGAASADVGLVVGSLSENPHSSNNTWIGIGRFFAYLGIAALTGTLLIAALIEPSALRSPRLATVLLSAGLLAVVSTVIMIAAQADMIGSSPFDWTAVADTRSGKWWLARLAMIGVLTVGLAWRQVLEHRKMIVPWILGATLLFAITAAGGHGVTGRLPALGYLMALLHLAAMAAWVGGLCTVGLVVPRSEIIATAGRMSPIALRAVAALTVTGLVNGWRQLRVRESLTDTAYGRWLIVKVVVVVVVVAAAYFARRIVASGDREHETSLLRNVWFELAGIVIILMVTAALAGTSPPLPGG